MLDATTIADSLREWAETNFGGDVEVVGTPSANGSGFDSAIYFVQLRGDALPNAWTEPLVVRVKPSVDALAVAEREADVQNWLADRGYPAPRVLALLRPGELGPKPAQVMQRAPGRDLLAAIGSAPWTARRRLHQLAALQARLHSIDPDGFPTSDDLLDRRLALVRRLVDDLDRETLTAGLARVEAISAELRGASAEVCHGDYHPLNAISDGSALSIIDWSDAGLGDRHGDVARTALLFEIAWIAVPNRAGRAALRTAGPVLRRSYLRSYRRHAALDDARLRLWYPVHLLHGWAQVLGATAGAYDDADVDVAGRLDASLADDLEQRFHAACRALESS